MHSTEAKLPYLTFMHRPGPEYSVRGEESSRTVVSPVFQTPDFSSLILCVNYHTATNGWLLTEAQVFSGGVWSKFFKLAFYSIKLNHSFDSQEDADASLAVDELLLKRPARAYRFRLTLHGDMEVNRVFVCLRDTQAVCPENFAAPPSGRREMSVRPFSQMCLPVAEEQKVRLCSPTSLAMALDALGFQTDPLQTASAVHDDRARIYGNWTLNTAYASRLGCEALVTRFTRLEQLKDFLTEKSLVLASIAYEKGRLSGAAVAQTPGHLVLLCGWENGKIRVADPAADTVSEVIRFYDAAEFARAWLERKQGAAYLVRRI